MKAQVLERKQVRPYSAYFKKYSTSSATCSRDSCVIKWREYRSNLTQQLSFEPFLVVSAVNDLNQSAMRVILKELIGKGLLWKSRENSVAFTQMTESDARRIADMLNALGGKSSVQEHISK
jgi:hypothetical protein